MLENKFKLKLTQSQANHLIEQIEKDCEFFEQNQIIDYSMLIGIHNNPLLRNNSILESIN